MSASSTFVQVYHPHPQGSGGADFIFIPERPPKVNPWEDELCAEIQKVGGSFCLGFPFVANKRRQHRAIGKRKTIVIVAEGAHDAELNPIRAEYIKDVLTERLGLDTRVTTLGHTQRGGSPCAMDRILVCQLFFVKESACLIFSCSPLFKVSRL